jgi:hypothetical protein
MRYGTNTEDMAQTQEIRHKHMRYGTDKGDMAQTQEIWHKHRRHGTDTGDMAQTRITCKCNIIYIVQVLNKINCTIHIGRYLKERS